MKKLIGIIFIGLMFCNIGFAEIKVIEEKLIKGELYNYTVSTICIDGYKFAIHKSSSGSNMVQFYECLNSHPLLNKLVLTPIYHRPVTSSY